MGAASAVEAAASPGGSVYLTSDSAVRSLSFIGWQPAPPAAAVATPLVLLDSICDMAPSALPFAYSNEPPTT